MQYIVVSARILNDGSVQEGTRRQKIVWPTELKEGGLYFLRHGLPGNGMLCRIVEKCEEADHA